MTEVCRDLDLVKEPFRPENSGQFRTKHLHRHLAVVLDVVGEVDGSHAAKAEFPLDSVAVGEGGFEAI